MKSAKLSMLLLVCLLCGLGACYPHYPATGDDDSAGDDDTGDDDTGDDDTGDDDTGDDDTGDDDDTATVDADGDGVPEQEDCDDNDAGLGAIAEDVDCDGVLTADDCDDTDASAGNTGTIVANDADCDGVVTAADCDDADAGVGDTGTNLATDADCDGVLTADDCDDGDSSSTVVATDADCDGVLTAADCDDGDSSSTVVADDADCDGVLTAADCDDGDSSSTVVADDGDCDGVLTAADCDDSDPNQVSFLCGVVLPSGTFDMGCTTGQSSCVATEYPVHAVTLTNNFWMSELEVTQGQWQALIGNNPSVFSSCGANCPVEYVNWWEALAFANALSAAENLAECYTLSDCISTPGNDMECSSATLTSTSGLPHDCTGYRLPTEAEWEYAARAGTDLLYAGSDTVGDVAWYSSNSGSTPHAVATKAPNAWGLYDMSGNVYEWVWDWSDSSYYSSSPTADPVGPSSGLSRVYRGGCWLLDANYTRVAFRNNGAPGYRFSRLGFRLARAIP